MLLHRDGHVELISERIGSPVAQYYETNALPIELVNGFSAALVSQRIARLGVRRLGLVEPEAFPAAIAALLPGAVGLVDVSHAFARLRMRKSAYELALIRESCRIGDAVWERVPEFFRLGRRNYEIVADIDHLVRLAGAESGFHLLLPLPFRGRAMQSVANPERIEANARYLMEISPRYDGYYSQLTIPVTTRPDDAVALHAYDAVVDAKSASQPLMRPGADLSRIATFVETYLAERGYEMASLSLGHFCGMALEEPRHDPVAPLILEEGMTLIFHPVLADTEIRSLMRADTYVITQDGAERLNRYGGGLLFIR